MDSFFVHSPRAFPMAISHREEIAPDAPTRLRNPHGPILQQFLLRNVDANLFALSWLENHGVEPYRPGYFCFWGWFDDSRRLQAVCLDVSERLLFIDSRSPELARGFGNFFRSRASRFQHIVSRRQSVEPLWQTYSRSDSARFVDARLIQHQRLYRLFPEHFRAPQEKQSGVRRGHIDELDPIFLASVQMHREETGEDPLEKNSSSFRRHVRHRIEKGRTFVWFDENRRLLFKADISTHCSLGAQISGVYTAPQVRNQGLATRAMADMCAELFAEELPRLTLYVNRTNAAARRVYEKLGFEFVTAYETIFVAD